MSVCLSIRNAKCVLELNGHFLKWKVDEIRCEERCRGKVNAIFLEFLLKIIQQR